MHFERPQVIPTCSNTNIDLPCLLCLGFAIISRIASTKQTPRVGVYEKLGSKSKENKLDEDDDEPKGLLFEGVRHSLMCAVCISVLI
eukprot:5872077-Ditylum_brightwellii.AAC.1